MSSRGISIMPKKADDTKKKLIIKAQEAQVLDTNTYISQRKAIKKYEGTVEQLTVRLPKGSRSLLNDYISKSNKYNSVNAMIKELLEKEIGKSLD